MLIFYQINDNKDGWEELGRIKDGEVISDETGYFEEIIEDQLHLSEERLARSYNNHYINAIVVDDEEDEQ
jgi:hypothetical protein